MTQRPTPPNGRTATWLLAAVAVALPIGIAVGLPFVAPLGDPPALLTVTGTHFPPANLPFDRQTLGPEPGYRPRITNVRIADLDKDGLPDVLVCDGQKNRVYWYRQLPGNKWDEVPLGGELNCPVCATPVDIDGDGDTDLVVAVLGSIWPTDERVGQVVLLENQDGKFANRVLLDDLRRVSDVQAGDLNGDGKIDLAVAEFGYNRGAIRWLENRGGGKFRDHLLFASSGPSHVPIADFDGDGDLDIVAIVSQEHEEVWAFENDGKGELRPKLLHGFTNFDLGSAGLLAGDLDKDGDLDLILSAGDNLEINYHYPQPWHGCLWLEYQGGWKYTPRRAGHVGGVYGTAMADLDGDGHNDLIAACMFNDWRTPGSASLVWLKNDGKQNFTAHQLADMPIFLATVAAGDLNGDGRPDLVAGSMHLMEPFDRLGRVTLWLSRKDGAK